MRVSRRLQAAASAALSVLLAGSLCGPAQAAGATGGARSAQLSARAATDSWEAQDCSDETYVLQASSVTITPKPLQKGTPLTVTVHGRLLEAVEEGATARVTVKLGVVTLWRKTLDIAEELRNHNADLQVPIAPGEVSLPLYYEDFFASGQVPKGDFRLYVEAYNYDDADLACVQAHIDLRTK